MKRSHSLVSLLCLVCFIGTTSNAQLRVRLGPKVGINLATMSYDPDVTNKSGRFAMMFGAVCELGFGKMFAVQIEPGYAMKGNSFDNIQIQDPNTGQVSTVTATRRISEIQFPILFKVKFLEGPVKLYSFLGPNLGIVASASVGVNSSGFTDTDEKATTSGMDFGFDFGSGAEFALTSKVALTGDVRYSMGFSNLFSPANQAAQQAVASRKTRGFQILFGALFQI